MFLSHQWIEARALWRINGCQVWEEPTCSCWIKKMNSSVEKERLLQLLCGNQSQRLLLAAFIAKRKNAYLVRGKGCASAFLAPSLSCSHDLGSVRTCSPL